MLRYLTALLMILLLLLACSEADKKPVSEIESVARTVVDQFSQEQYDPIVALFDSTMKANVSTEQLAQVQNSLISQCGEFEKQSELTRIVEPPFEVVYIQMDFSGGPYYAKVIFNESQEIAGLRFVPNIPKENNTVAEYIKPDQFVERGGEFGGDEWQLSGVATFPKGDGLFPAVILVHSHGPYDKNETIGANTPFKDIAGGLASQGIAVLRYDNRTYTYKDRYDTLSEPTVQHEIIRDIHYAITLMKTSPGIDSNRVYVLGHGFGGMLLPKVAEQTNFAAGYIAMGAPTRPLQQVIFDEMEFIYAEDGDISGSEQNALDKLAGEAQMVDNPDLTKDLPGKYLPLGFSGSYWLDLRKYDPIEKALEMTEPLLVLHGERDYHATMQDFEKWRELQLVRDNVEYRSFPYLNHLFIRGEGRSSPEEYMKPGHVDGEVIYHIAKWIKSQN